MNMSHIAVIGRNGQIGRALCDILGKAAISFSSAELNLLDMPKSLATLESARPDAVINAAAYTKVDKAQDEADICHAINAVAPGKLAEWCARHRIPFVHYSTDYVFDGSGDIPWEESDQPAPLNVYGHSKWLGEKAVEAAGGNYLIFRTSWVYDAYGINFLNTMLRLGKTHESLKVVNDQFGAPSYAPHIAEASIHSLEKALAMPTFPKGIYHMVNHDVMSWYGFAKAIFGEARQAGVDLCIKNVEPIPSLAYPTPAQRPQNSRLNPAKLQHVFDESLPPFKTGLSEAIRILHASHRLPD